MRDGKQAGFATFEIILFLFTSITIVGAYLAVAHFRSTNESPKIHSAVSSTNSKEVKVTEGTQEVLFDKNTVAVLPTGATIDLTHFSFNPDSTDYSDQTETNKFEHSPTFSAYHKGYIYSFIAYNCKNGEVGYDDYTINERISCKLKISAQKAAQPEVADYDGASLTVSSQSRQIYDHSLKTAAISTAKNGEPYYEVEVPYMQFFGEGDGVYWGTSGNHLHIKTGYGIADLVFDESPFDSDLRNQTVKSAAIGPMTVHVKMTGVGCYPPYLDANNQCSPHIMTSGPHQGKTVYTYNRVDYKLNFSQPKRQKTDQLVIHY